jgi:hypothetical protein
MEPLAGYKEKEYAEENDGQKSIKDSGKKRIEDSGGSLTNDWNPQGDPKAGAEVSEFQIPQRKKRLRLNQGWMHEYL